MIHHSTNDSKLLSFITHYQKNSTKTQSIKITSLILNKQYNGYKNAYNVYSIILYKQIINNRMYVCCMFFRRKIKNG